MRISDWSSDVCSSDLNWGSLAQPGDPRYDNITNRPEGNDVYQVPQNASYDLNDINRERINGQAVLQFRPTDALTATVDYTYSRNTVEKIGRASCRERVWQYGKISVGAVDIKKKTK